MKKNSALVEVMVDKAASLQNKLVHTCVTQNSPAHISFVNLCAFFVQLGAHGWPQPQGVPDIPPDDTVLHSPKVRLEFGYGFSMEG